MIKEMIGRCIAKMASGRWILTVTCAGVFAYAVFKDSIPKDATVSILTMVFVSYFNKGTDSSGGQAK